MSFFKLFTNSPFVFALLFLGACNNEDKSASNELIYFSIDDPNIMTKIDHDNHIIYVYASSLTNITNLRPIIKVSDLAKAVPASGLNQDFSDLLHYNIYAENGNEKTYTVEVVRVDAFSELDYTISDFNLDEEALCQSKDIYLRLEKGWASMGDQEYSTIMIQSLSNRFDVDKIKLGPHLIEQYGIEFKFYGVDIFSNNGSHNVSFLEGNNPVRVEAWVINYHSTGFSKHRVYGIIYITDYNINNQTISGSFSLERIIDAPCNELIELGTIRVQDGTFDNLPIIAD